MRALPTIMGIENDTHTQKQTPYTYMGIENDTQP